MPDKHLLDDDGEAALVVILHKLALNKVSNFFATLKVDFPPQNQPDAYSTDDSVTHRTEVQKATKQPVFKTRAFIFKLPPSTSNAFSELLLYSPCLYVQLYEVLRKDERGIAKPYGTATLAFSKDQIESLVSRKAIVLSLMLVASNSGSNVGQCDIEISMSDTSASPPSPTPSTPSPMHMTHEKERVRYDYNNQKSLTSGVLDDAECLTFTITVHCGVNLGTQNLPPPSPFVTAKTTRDAAAKRPAKTATMMSKNQRNVLWNEKLNVSMSRKDVAEGQGIFLAVIDFETKRYIGKCILPVKGCVIGYQYHMKLLTHEDGYLLVTLSVEDKMDPEFNRFIRDPDLYHVQLSLKRLLDPVAEKHSNLVAVVNLIDDGQAYKQNYIADNVPKIPFDTLLMAEAHDKFGMVKQHWSKVWQFFNASQQTSQLFEFPLEKKQRQTNFCITVEFFYLDFSMVVGSVTPISPMSPLSPMTPQSSTPHFPSNPFPKDGSAGIVFWGSAVIPLYEFIRGPARTVAAEIELPVYRSPHIVNRLELDIKRRDAHDYLRDIAGKPQQPEKNQNLKVINKNDRGRSPSPSPLSPQIMRQQGGERGDRGERGERIDRGETASPVPSRMSATPSPVPPSHSPVPPPNSHSPPPKQGHRDSTSYSMQNGFISAGGKQHAQQMVDLIPNPGGASPSSDTPHSPNFSSSIAKRNSLPRQTFRELTIVPPTTPGPGLIENPTPTVSKMTTQNFIPNQKQHYLQQQQQQPQNGNRRGGMHEEEGEDREGEGEREMSQKYRYGEIESSTSSDLSGGSQTMDGRDVTTIDDRSRGDDVRKLLEQQQRILDQLMQDREGTNKTLRKVEKDLTDLKGENILLQSENTQLKDKSGKTSGMESKLSELTDAQQKMASVIESLQTENAKIPGYLSTNKKQEKIITKLESLLKFAIAEMKKGSKLQADLQSANETNQKLQQELNALKKRYEVGIQGVSSKPRLAATLDVPPNGGMITSLSSSSLNGNYDKSNQVDARIKQVENEMAKNAEVLAMELNNLRTRLQRSQFSSENLLSVPSIPTLSSSNSLSKSSSNNNLSRSPSSNGLSRTRTSSSSSSPNGSPNSSVALPQSLSSSASSQGNLDKSHSNGNFDKNWDLYSSNRASLSSSSRIKAKKNMPVKHKETGEYRRPHMLVPMTSPPPT